MITVSIGMKKPSEALRTGMCICHYQCRGSYIQISPKTGRVSACAFALIYAGYTEQLPLHWKEIAQDLYKKTGIDLSQPVDPTRPSFPAICVICDFNDIGLSFTKIAQRLEMFGA